MQHRGLDTCRSPRFCGRMPHFQYLEFGIRRRGVAFLRPQKRGLLQGHIHHDSNGAEGFRGRTEVQAVSPYTVFPGSMRTGRSQRSATGMCAQANVPGKTVYGDTAGFRTPKPRLASRAKAMEHLRFCSAGRGERGGFAVGEEAPFGGRRA